jgi:hypothetical protein
LWNPKPGSRVAEDRAEEGATKSGDPGFVAFSAFTFIDLVLSEIAMLSH